jgi:urease accessory protein
MIKDEGMSSTQALLNQRAQGSVTLRVKAGGIETIREQGAAKIRLPPGLTHAYLINTAGGLAGGDEFSNQITVGERASLTVTTQAAERVYRSLGPPAHVQNHVILMPHARLNWLPHETILFDGANFSRKITIEMDQTARFLGLETTIFGREASGETMNAIALHDEWHITRQGKLVHADIIKLDGHLPTSSATLGHAKAMATILLVDSTAQAQVERVRAMIGKLGGASAWNGKLIARLLAKDGLQLKKAVSSVLSALARPDELPKNWMM